GDPVRPHDHRPGVRRPLQVPIGEALRGRQSGQTLIMFAITMTFMFLALIALVGDAVTLMVRYNQVNSEALLGAQTGATAVDEDPFSRAGHRLNMADAVSRCEGITLVGGGGAHTIDCKPDPAAADTITATVSWDVSLPIPLFFPQATVRSTRTGRAVF